MYKCSVSVFTTLRYTARYTSRYTPRYTPGITKVTHNNTNVYKNGELVKFVLSVHVYLLHLIYRI